MWKNFLKTGFLVTSQLVYFDLLTSFYQSVIKMKPDYRGTCNATTSGSGASLLEQ